MNLKISTRRRSRVFSNKSIIGAIPGAVIQSLGISGSRPTALLVWTRTYEHLGYQSDRKSNDREIVHLFRGDLRA